VGFSRSIIFYDLIKYKFVKKLYFEMFLEYRNYQIVPLALFGYLDNYFSNYGFRVLFSLVKKFYGFKIPIPK
jgi:hypothetical protein